MPSMLDNTTKAHWTAQGSTVVDDTGEPISICSHPGVAHYQARLHNNHVSGHPILREVDRMFQSEIHFGISACWDGGIDWFLGLNMTETQIEQLTSPHQLIGNAATIEEALADLVNAARKAYPESTFAQLYQSDATVDPDQRGVEELVAALSVYGTVTTRYEPKDIDPWAPWTVEVVLGGEKPAGFAGESQIGTLRFALDTLNERAVSSEA